MRSEENLPNDPTVEVTFVAVTVEAVIWLAVVVPEMSTVATCSAPRVAPDGENCAYVVLPGIHMYGVGVLQ